MKLKNLEVGAWYLDLKFLPTSNHLTLEWNRWRQKQEKGSSIKLFWDVDIGRQENKAEWEGVISDY